MSIFSLFVFVLSFSGFDENTMKFGSPNNPRVDSTNPDPKLLEREGEEAKKEVLLVEQEARAKEVHTRLRQRETKHK